jgi:hypothetical protein
METKEKEIEITGLDELFKKQKAENETTLKAFMSDFEDRLKTIYRVDNGPVKMADVVPSGTVAIPEKAKMSGIMDSVSSINWKDIAVGGFVSMVATEMVDGFLAKQNTYVRAGAKVLLAVVAGKYLAKISFIGSGGAKVITTLMVFDALRDAIPVDTYVKQLTGKVTGMVTSAGLAGAGPFKAVSVNQSGNYYSRAQGR